MPTTVPSTRRKAAKKPARRGSAEAAWRRVQPRVPDLSKRYTYEELCAVMEETNRPHELWDGELIMSPTPDFRHQKIVLFIAREMQAFVAQRGLGEVAISPFDMVVSPRRAFQPDVLFIAREHLDRIDKVLRGPADLVVEVISEHGRRRDRIEKRDIYAQHGIPEYWMVDPEARTVEVLTLERGEYRLAGRYLPGESAPSVLLDGFAVEVEHVFAG